MAANRFRRAARWLAGTGVLALPACYSLETVPEAGLPPAPRALVAAKPPPPAILQAGGQVKAGDAEVASSSPGRPSLPPAPPAGAQGKPLPINLPTALAISDASPLDIQIAAERLRVASAALDRARVMGLPNVNVGVDYFRHDGQIQDIVGTVFTTSRSSLLLGAGPQAVFPVSEALYAPLAARQIVRARQAEVQAARNDVTLQVAEAYFTVQQARGELAGSLDALRRAEELLGRAEKLAPGLTPAVEVNRARAEAARRRQAVEAAYERWQVASADLTRLLRLEPGTLVEPAEEPSLTVTLIDPAVPPDELAPIALTNRPELAADQALIQAALARVRQEEVRPFVPTLAVRGVGSQTPGLAGGYFGGGVNDFVGNFGGRFSVDLQAVWEVQNLGFGNRAARRERQAESRLALLQLLRTQDRVVAEVVQAHARVRRSAARLQAAEAGLADAAETAEKNILGLGQTRRAGDQLVLVFRPQEAVAAVAALDQAYRDYFAAVADHNRAQFQLYRALGHPAQCLAASALPPATLPATTVPAPAVRWTPSPPPVPPGQPEIKKN
jgi:outer membrane protein TolC